MKNINAKIAETILRAQNASNGGKFNRYNDCSTFKGRNATDNMSGYDLKDTLIKQAISLISTGKSNFKFSVQEDTEGRARYIVYFNTNINGTKYQVSFHTFMNLRVSKYFTRWDRGYLSQDNAISIYKHYCPNGKYLEQKKR